MGTITDSIAITFRDFVADGIPSSGVHEPTKSDVRALGPLIEAAIGNAGLGALVSVTKTTRALLDADLAHDADTVALVYADATDANNDLYVKIGASGAGSWTLTNVLHGAIDALVQGYVDAAEAAANSIPDSGLSNLWNDGRFRALYDANANIGPGAGALYLGSSARVLATAGALAWDTASSPFGNPALVCSGTSTDMYISLAEMSLRVGQTIRSKIGVIVDSASTFSTQLFARASVAGTVTGSTAGVSVVGSGAYAEIDLAAFTIPAGTTVLALRLTRTAGTGSAKACSIQAVLGTLARPLDEDRPSSFAAYRAALLAGASNAAAAQNNAVLTAAFDSSKNLFNPADSDVLPGYFINWTTGLPTASVSYNATGYIPVTPGATYTVSFGHQLAYFDQFRRYVSGVDNTGSVTGATVTIPAGCYFVRQGVSTAIWSTFQIEVGSMKTSYAPFTPALKSAALPPITEEMLPPLAGSMFADESIAIEKLTPLDRSKNRFNPADPDVAPGYFVSYSTGNLSANATYTASGFIPCASGETYTVSYSHQRAFYNASKVYIGGTNSGNPATFTTPAETAFMRLTILATAVSSFQVEQGGAATAYEPYYEPRIPYESLPPSIAALADRLAAVTTEDAAPLWNPYKPEFMRHCHYRLMRLLLGESGQLVISAAGDSFTHNPFRWIGPFAAYMAAKYGDAGGGWSGFGFATSEGQVSPWNAGNQPAYKQGNARLATYPMTIYGNITSTYSNSAAGSPDLAVITMTGAGDYVTQAIPASPVHNGCTLLFVGTSDGVVRWRWDSGAWTTLNVQGTVGQTQTASLVAGIPSGAGLLTIEWVSGTVKLCGTNLTSAANGVRVNKLGCTGSNISQWATAPATEWERALGFLGHHAFIFMDGTNSQTSAMSRSVWGNHLDTIVSRVRSATPGLDVLIATPPENQAGRATSMTTYAKEGRKRAVAGRFTFHDMQDAFGDPFNPTEYGSTGAIPLFNADLIHPEPATGGRRMLAEFLRVVEPV